MHIIPIAIQQAMNELQPMMETGQPLGMSQGACQANRHAQILSARQQPRSAFSYTGPVGLLGRNQRIAELLLGFTLRRLIQLTILRVINLAQVRAARRFRYHLSSSNSSSIMIPPLTISSRQTITRLQLTSVGSLRER